MVGFDAFGPDNPGMTGFPSKTRTISLFRLCVILTLSGMSASTLVQIPVGRIALPNF
jgi:hypothetical protein